MTNGCPLPQSRATRSPAPIPSPARPPRRRSIWSRSSPYVIVLVAADEGDRVGGVPVDDVGDVHQIDVVRPARRQLAPMSPGRHVPQMRRSAITPATRIASSNRPMARVVAGRIAAQATGRGAA